MNGEKGPRLFARWFKINKKEVSYLLYINCSCYRYMYVYIYIYINMGPAFLQPHEFFFNLRGSVFVSTSFFF